MAIPKPPGSFVDFVEARSDALLRAAWLLTGDAGRAEDLLQTALAKAWRRWGATETAANPEAYVRRVIFTTYVSSWRRRWRTELPSGDPPERVVPLEVADEIATRDAVVRAPGGMGRRSR